MEPLLWLIVFMPFLGALTLAIFGAYFPKKAAGAIGCATVGVSWIAAMVVLGLFLSRGTNTAVDTTIYTWMYVGKLRIPMGLHLDPLSLVYMLIVTFVGFLILLYSSQFMYDDEDYSRFFSYMNLFVGSMLTLVLANNLVLFYLGWEGVGLCSYLLIGFWYKDANNGRAAQKAFIVTRVGDTALIVALFLLYRQFGTLDLYGPGGILPTARSVLVGGSAMATIIAALALGGAVGKSAQVPLQTWLPDAMAGPTPVSALIHAATMVTAGVYLIARLHALFLLAPGALLAVAVVGTITLFYSGFSGLVQRDIKRVLAYSTISQIGYMFLALGVGAWTAAIFHFVAHAFFKALLFLAAGVVIQALHEEHDLFRMGGLRRHLPVAYWTFLIGASALSALPLVTAGFFSKDAIIWSAYTSRISMTWFWVLALLAALLTAGYAFRAWFLAFWGPEREEIAKYPGVLMKISLIVLAFFSITVGYMGWPRVISRFDPFGAFLSEVLPPVTPVGASAGHAAESLLLFGSSFLAFLGIYVAYEYFRHSRWAGVVERAPLARAFHTFFFSGWEFDLVYDRVFVRPYKAIAYADRSDFTDWFFKGWTELARVLHTVLSFAQTGRVRNYAAGLVLGAVAIAAIVLLK